MATYILTAAQLNNRILNSFVITAASTIPINTVAPVLSGTNLVGQTLTSSTGTWTGTPPITFGYQWKRNSTNISSATSSAYVTVQGDLSQSILCLVTATDSQGSASASSNSVTINQIPTNTVAPVISGTQVVGQTLSTTNGTWVGTPTITFGYQWKRNGSNIVGATSSTYTLVSGDAGVSTTIQCVVTGTNSIGNSNANSNILTGIDTVPTVSDANAQAFLNAAGITSTTQANAVNNLVIGLKADSLWNNLDNIYPFVGGTASTHKWNLKNTGSTQLTFLGGVIHNSNGITGNGSNGYVDTNNYTALSVGVYVRTSSVTLFGKRRSFVGEEGPYFDRFATLYGGYFGSAGSFRGDTGVDTQYGDPPYKGFINVIGSNSSAANQVKIYREGVNSALTSPATSTPWTTEAKFGLLAVQNTETNDLSGQTTTFSESNGDANLAFATLTDVILNSTQNANLSTRVEAFQVELGRQAPATVSDPNAQAFINAANISNTTQANAVNNLVIGLKADNLWTTLDAIYPFVGGTASTHKWNLKDPRDLDAAYRLQFNGGMTHSANGILFNGTNGWADTSGTNGDIDYFGCYTRNSSDNGKDYMGSQNSQLIDDGDGPYFVYLNGFQLARDIFILSSRNGFGGTNNTISTGLSLVTKKASSGQSVYYKNGIQKGTANNPVFTSTAFPPIAIGALNPNSDLSAGTVGIEGYSNQQIALAFIGNSELNATQNTNIYNRIQTFQTALSRQV